MSIAESLRVALEALGANKLRSALTMIGIIIGVASVVAIIAIGRSTSAAIMAELNDFSAGTFVMTPAAADPMDLEGRVELFSDADIQMLRALLPEVKAVLPSSSVSAPVRFGQRGQNAMITGSVAAEPEVMSTKVSQGRWFTRIEEQQGAAVVVIGADVPKRILGERTAPIGQIISIAGYSFEVIGVTERATGALSNLANQEDLSYRVPLRWLQRITGSDKSQGVLVTVKPGADPEAVMTDAVALMERSHNGAKYSGLNLSSISKSINRVFAIITTVLSGIASFSLVVGGVGIMNIMLVSVTERTREIGVRKAIGATYGDILRQFLIEAVILSLIGGMIGLGLASIPIWAFTSWMKIGFKIDWVTVAMSVAFSVGVGVLFGVYPASRAARLDPIEALRYE